MKAIVQLGLAASLSWAAAAIAQEPANSPANLPANSPTSFGRLEGMVGRPQLAAAPREGQASAVSPAEDGAARERPPARGTPLSLVPLDSLRATRERPVFAETRRPPVVAIAEPVRMVEPSPEPEPAEPEAPGLTLIGTVVGAQETVAVFRSTTAREVIRLRIGEADAGWTLRSVQPKSTTLEKASREVTLALAPPDASSAPGGDTPGGIDAFMRPPPGLGGVPGNPAASRGKPPVPFPSGRPGRQRPQRAQPGHEF